MALSGSDMSPRAIASFFSSSRTVVSCIDVICLSSLVSPNPGSFNSPESFALPMFHVFSGLLSLLSEVQICGQTHCLLLQDQRFLLLLSIRELSLDLAVLAHFHEGLAAQTCLGQHCSSLVRRAPCLALHETVQYSAQKDSIRLVVCRRVAR